jgi:hypothetical protein
MSTKKNQPSKTPTKISESHANSDLHIVSTQKLLPKEKQVKFTEKIESPLKL